MRKFSRAALAVIATMSLVALVIYRNEYNRLRHVLEVFNYFGHPGEKSLPENCTGIFKTMDITSASEFGNYDFGSPIPAWQRLNDDAYVYSAYALNDRKILAVGFGKIVAIERFACGIYHDNEIRPVIGIFHHKIIEMTSSVDKSSNASEKQIYSAYRFVCTKKIGKITDKPIVGVSFADRTELFGNAIVLPVKSLVGYIGSKNESYEFSLCVAPTESRTILHRDIVDFLSFHDSIGIRNFVVYDFGITTKFNDVLRKISKKLNFSYTTVPWNFPFVEVSMDIVRRIIQTDCRYRTYKNVEFATTLTWNDYIIMKYHRNVTKLFVDVDDVGFVADRYKISTMKFCIEQRETKSKVATTIDAEPIVLGTETFDAARPIYFVRSRREKIIDIDGDDDDVATTREITSDIISVNRYEKNCNRSLNLIRQNDPYVGKFAKNIRESAMYKLYRTYGD